MATDDVFPAEMPDHPSRPIPPLDDDTAERLLSGRLDPDDAPPFYADVARLLQAAAGPGDPDELGGEEMALALFRAGRPTGAGVEARSGQRSRRAGLGSRSGRGRLVALALAGVLVVGGAAAGGLWTTGGVPPSGRLRSPTGGPGAGPAGSAAPAFGVETRARTGSGGSGSLGQAGPGADADGGRAVARHRGGGGSRGGGAVHGAKPVQARKAKPGEAKAGKPGKPASREPPSKGPKAAPGQGADHPHARPK